MALSKAQTEQILIDLKELTPEQQNQYLDALEKQFGSAAPSAPAEPPVDPNAGPAWLRAAEAGMSAEGGAYADPNATPEDMAGRAESMANVAALAAGPGVASAIGRVPGAVGTAARYAIANPTKTGFAIGAVPRLLRGDVLGAAEQGTLFALLGAGGKAARVLKKLGGWGVAEAEAAAAKGAASAPVVRSTTGVVPASVPMSGTTGSMHATVRAPGPVAVDTAAAERAAVEAERMAMRKRALELGERRVTLAEQKAAAAASPGAARAATHNKVMAFAKEAAGKSPKIGEKVWMELDADGLPIKVLTPDEAAAAKRAGKATTWVKNLWEKPAQAPPAGGASTLQGPRIQVGAQKVGKAVGMTKEEVRREAGPVLNEAVGEASPVLPKEALKGIIDKMRAIPMAEREAYVAKATSGKTQWQVENIRRTLEHLGLLLPVGAAAAATREK